VDDSVVLELAQYKPTLEESGNDIVYPKGYEHIPKYRQAYWYYSARAEKDGDYESVLVRRAKVPVAGVVELFSAIPLTSRFGLVANDVLTVQVLAPWRHTEAGA
jgi:hypothetical protein